MRLNAVLLLLIAVAGCAYALDPQLVERGRKEEESICVACHSLRLVDSQRLSAAAWEKEIGKMAGWGAVIPDRKLLLDYLSQEYSAAKPMASARLTTPSSK